MADSIPIFEAKNRLPFYIHKAETEGSVFLSRRGKNVAVIISMAEYEEKFLKKRSFIDDVQGLRKEYKDVLDNHDIYRDVRDRYVFGRPGIDQLFDEED